MNTRTLHAVIVISNSVGYASRYKLHREFIRRYDGYTEEFDGKTYKLHLTIVEQAFGARPFEVTEPNNPDHVQVRTIEELWHKEVMVNLGVQRLTENFPCWEDMAWIDADIAFQNPRWLSDTITQLDRYQVVQMWEDAIDLGPDHQFLQAHKSFMSLYVKGAVRKKPAGGYSYPHWHPGYAWACTRQAYDALGGLIDIAILGAGDHHMALGLIGEMKDSVPGGMHGDYARELLEWESKAEHWIKRDVGYVRGTITHFWHGKKRDRRYQDRWKILVGNHYSPRRDLKKDAFGLWQLETQTLRQVRLRDQIRGYLAARSEDSIDLE